jgi:hypothetical protein
MTKKTINTCLVGATVRTNKQAPEFAGPGYDEYERVKGAGYSLRVKEGWADQEATIANVYLDEDGSPKYTLVKNDDGDTIETYASTFRVLLDVAVRQRDHIIDSVCGKRGIQ